MVLGDSEALADELDGAMDICTPGLGATPAEGGIDHDVPATWHGWTARNMSSPPPYRTRRKNRLMRNGGTRPAMESPPTARQSGGAMADVQIQQTPDAGGGGGGWVWALVVLILVVVLAWFIFGGGLHRTNTTKIDVNVPGASSGGGGGGGATGGASGGGATKGP